MKIIYKLTIAIGLVILALLVLAPLSASAYTNTICSNGNCAYINCSQNSDCGINRFVGEQTCQQDSIYQSYLTFTCNNPGTVSANCTSLTNPKLVQTCAANQCVAGRCLEVAPNQTYSSSFYKRCVGNSVYWFDSNGNQQALYQACGYNQTCYNNSCVNQVQNYLAASVTPPKTASITTTSTVRNLSFGNLNWSSSVSASPNDIIQFNVTIENSTNQAINNVTVKDILPSNLIYNSNLTLEGVANSESIISGLNLGTLLARQGKTITYQAQVATAQNFSLNTTILSNAVSVESQGLEPTSTSFAYVIVTKQGVLGATAVPTGLTNNLLIDSFFLPLLLILIGIWLYKQKFIKLPQWASAIQSGSQERKAQKELQNKITQIKSRLQDNRMV